MEMAISLGDAGGTRRGFSLIFPGSSVDPGPDPDLGIDIDFSPGAVKTVQVPVVESLLAAAAGFNGIGGLGFAHQRLGLAALNAFQEKLLAAEFHILLRVCGVRSKNGCGARCGDRLFQSREAAHELLDKVAVQSAGYDKLAAVALALRD
jgi:hypothetical protein